MKSNNRGFSIVELMLSLILTLMIALVVFQLFRQNDRGFRDQNLTARMQQNVRAVASQIADELRMAGQNIPVYSGKFDAAPVEACQTILDGSNGTRLAFRSGISNVNARGTSPLAYTIGTPATVSVTDATPFNTAIGGMSGRFVYLHGKTPNLWGWVRAEVTAINVGGNTITVTPAQNGSMGTTFANPMTVSLEEGISYRLSGNTIQRGTVSDFTNLTSPTIVEAPVGNDFTSLQFTYYNRAGTAITPSTLAVRAQVWRVDMTVVGQTAQNLSNGTRPTFAMTVRTFPRNVGID
jgi:type II secretory pathway pseudopilin PulG